MSGLDEILKNIDLKQKESEKGITDAADKRINAIREEAELKAQILKMPVLRQIQL